jgi:hypothetical protein
MKRNIKYAAAAAAMMLILGGCAKKDETAQNLTPEQKLAEAEKKAAEAQAELAKARESAAAPAQAQQGQGAQGKGSGWGQAAPGQPAAPPPPPPPPKVYTVPAGTAVTIRTITSLSTKTAQNGAPFEGTLDKALVVDGFTVAPRGADVKGAVVLSDPGGKVKGVASLSVALTSIHTSDGKVATVSTSEFVQTAKSTKKKDAAKIGIGAGVGAAIGAIAGGGKGAAIGAGVGGAAGTGAVMMTKGDPAVLPSESLVTVTLKSPISVTAAAK